MIAVILSAAALFAAESKDLVFLRIVENGGEPPGPSTSLSADALNCGRDDSFLLFKQQKSKHTQKRQFTSETYAYFSTRMNCPVVASTATASLASERELP